MGHKLKKPGDTKAAAPKAKAKAAPSVKSSSSGAPASKTPVGTRPGRGTRPAVAKAAPAGAQPPAPVATRRETELLDRINAGFSEPQFRRLQELDSLRQQGRLSSAELAEFLALADASERMRNDRFEALAELASLRGLSVASLIERMGLGPSRG